MIKVKNDYKALNKISEKLQSTIKDSVEDVLKNIQTNAIKLERGHNDGILVEIVDTSDMSIKGRVYTDSTTFPYAMFEHYGTGEFAEQAHVGITKHFLESGYTEWYIPTTSVPRPLNYPIIKIQGNEYYVAHGVKSNHFMTDAEFNTREENLNIVKKKINNLIKEACK